MRYCDLTLPTPALNLAADEALLEQCEAGETDELLRFWEPADYFVVLGYANRAATEVNLDFCREQRIPVLRRCSGGGTVLQGPGCLNYSLILRIDRAPALGTIPGTNRFVLDRHTQALSALLEKPVERQGHTDLTLEGVKFSGNAQRRRKHCLLFHGSFLLHMDLDLIERALPMPSKQPDYRSNRSHADFLTNLELPPDKLKAALLTAWQASLPFESTPLRQIQRLVTDKYTRDDWNLKF